MAKRRFWLVAGALAALFLGGIASPCLLRSLDVVPALQAKNTDAPQINLPHVFEGEINKRGKPVGFHSRPGGKDPENARVVRIVDGPNHLGVYIAEVEIRSGDRWLRKKSTFFPDRMSRAAVIEAISEVYLAAPKSEKFRGPSDQGFVIEGYFQKGRINTAWPIFIQGDRQ